MCADTIAALMVQAHRKLLGKQFIEFHPLPRRMRPVFQRCAVNVRRRLMEQPNGNGKQIKPKVASHLVRERFRQIGFSQRARDQFA